MATKVHSITSTKVLSQFMHSFAYWIAVTKIPRLQAFETDTNFGLCLFTVAIR